MFRNTHAESLHSATPHAITIPNKRPLTSLFSRIRDWGLPSAEERPDSHRIGYPHPLKSSPPPQPRGDSGNDDAPSPPLQARRSTSTPQDLVNDLYSAGTGKDLHDALDEVRGTIHHPRSLARAIATWRPPRIRLPLTADSPEFIVSVSRHRAGARVREFVQAFGEDREPAYLITVRFSDPTGRPVHTHQADAWVRRFTPGAPEHCIHELRGEATPTYCWLVDGAFAPLASPSSLFKEEGFAA